MDGAQLMQVWVTGGGPYGWAALMAGIALAESGGDPSAVQQGQPYATTGWGLWQITPGDSEPQAGTNAELLTPRRNAVAAVAKFHAQGLGAWYGDRTWNAWQRAGAPSTPTAPQVAAYVASWGGSFGPANAGPSSTVPGAPGTAETGWVHWQGYVQTAFPVQMAQWDALTRAIDRV